MADSTESVESRVRMLEEIARGQDGQLRLLVANDDRRMELDTKYVIEANRTADALKSMREGAKSDLERILVKIDDKFLTLDRQIECVAKAQTEQEKTLDAHATSLSDHASFIKSMRWWLVATWGLFTAAALVLVNHWISLIK
jgi:hypothetical protein